MCTFQSMAASLRVVRCKSLVRYKKGYGISSPGAQLLQQKVTSYPCEKGFKM